MVVKKRATEQTDKVIQREVAKAVADAAVATAKVLAADNMEARVSLIEGKLGHMEAEIKRGNIVADEILAIVKVGKLTGQIFKWVASFGAAIAAMVTAWHWYGR